MRTSAPPGHRMHAFLTSVAVCLTMVALAAALSGCKGDAEPPEPDRTTFIRATGHPCRC